MIFGKEPGPQRGRGIREGEGPGARAPGKREPRWRERLRGAKQRGAGPARAGAPGRAAGPERPGAGPTKGVLRKSRIGARRKPGGDLSMSPRRKPGRAGTLEVRNLAVFGRIESISWRV